MIVVRRTSLKASGGITTIAFVFSTFLFVVCLWRCIKRYDLSPENDEAMEMVTIPNEYDMEPENADE